MSHERERDALRPSAKSQKRTADTLVDDQTAPPANKLTKTGQIAQTVTHGTQKSTDARETQASACQSERSTQAEQPTTSTARSENAVPEPHSAREPKPSETTNTFWLHEPALGVKTARDYPLWESGKWMTFHPISDLDQAWERAKTLYRTGQIPGVNSMKVATVKPNPTYADRPTKVKVICFYCGPASDEEGMRAIGRQLAEKMNYPNRTISYKTDQQTMAGTRGSTYTIYLR